MKQNKLLIFLFTIIFTSLSFSTQIPKEENHLMFLRKEIPVEGEQKIGYIIYANKKAGKYVHTNAKEEGISCVDDTARAGLYFLYMYANTEDKASEEAKRYKELFLETLDFCEAFRTRTGDYYNFVFENGDINRKGITSRASASWWALRELWLLSEALNVLEDNSDFNSEVIYKKAEQTANLFIEEIDTKGLIRGYTDLSSLYVIALSNLYKYADDDKWLPLIQTVSDGIISKQTDLIFNGIIDEGKEAFNYHSWGSRQVQALSMAYAITSNEKYLDSARNMADSLYTHMINVGPFYDYNDKNINLFSQIAYGTEAAVTSLYHLYKVTGEEKYALMMALNAGFFYGNNQLNRPMAGENGEGFDGLEKVFINSNAGAESTISYLLTLSLIERIPEELRRFTFMKPVHKSKHLLIEAENMDAGLSNCTVETRNGLGGIAGKSFKLKENFSLEKGKYDVYFLGENLENTEIKFYMGKSKISTILTPENTNYIGRVENTSDEAFRMIFSSKAENEVFINQILCLPVIEYQIFKEGEINQLVAFNTSDEEASFENQKLSENDYLLSETNFDLREEQITEEKKIFEIENYESDSEFTMLNLEELMNNNGIGTPLEPGNLDNFGGKSGAYYPEDKIISKSLNGNWYAEEIPFKILPKEQDNIIAGGQILKIDHTVNEVFIFGSCDHGDFNGDIEICYSNGEKEYLSLGFPDWCADIRNEEQIALEVPYRYNADNLKEWINPKIYIKKFSLNGKKIESITLPEIPTMHIFGITLKKD